MGSFKDHRIPKAFLTSKKDEPFLVQNLLVLCISPVLHIEQRLNVMAF